MIEAPRERATPAPEELLAFERDFLVWTGAKGVRWDSLRIPGGAGSPCTTSGHLLTPAGGADRVLVALHGAGNDALFAWVGLFKRLLTDRTAVLTFDLPGHGRFNEGQFSCSTTCSTLETALAEVRRRFPAIPVLALGVSLGGAVLLHALPHSQNLVRAAALIVAPLQIVLSARSLSGELGRRTLGLIWREREHYGLTGLIPSFGPFKRGTYPLRLAGEVPSGMFGYVKTLNAEIEAMNLEEAAALVQVPVLLVYGSADRIVPAEQGQRLAALMPRSRLEIIPGGTHLSTPLERPTLDLVQHWVRSA